MMFGLRKRSGLVLLNEAGKALFFCKTQEARSKKQEAAISEFAKRRGGIILNDGDLKMYETTMVRCGWAIKPAVMEIRW